MSEQVASVRGSIERRAVNVVLKLVVFGALLLAPALAQMLSIGQSSTENRQLAPFPTLKTFRDVKDLSRMAENFVNDRFGLRSQLVYINSLVRYRIRSSSSKDVVIGRDGWLFYTADKILEQHTGADVFAFGELENWVRQMERNRDWLEKRGIAFIILVAPEKSAIYPENLPDYPRRPGAPNRLDQLVARLRTSTLEFVDPRAELINAKEFGLKVYFEGDTHWTQRGAFITYSLLMNRLKGRFPNLTVKLINDYDISTNLAPAADLARLLMLEGHLRYSVEQFSVRGTPHQITAPNITTRVGWPWRVTEMSSDLINSPRLLIMGDSFSDYVLGPTFLYETFRDPVWTHHNLGTFNFDLVKEIMPKVVIFEFAERYLHSPLGSPIGMD
jgi:hypothetical protein